MNADGGDDFIVFGVDHADAVRLRVHHINFILLAIGRNSGGFAADPNRLRRLESAQVDNRNSITLAVGYVGVLAVGGTIRRQLAHVEIPPPKRACHREYDNEEKNFFQTDGLTEGATPVPTRAGGCVPIAGTVLPTTGAICRTCLINSSNCSG